MAIMAQSIIGHKCVFKFIQFDPQLMPKLKRDWLPDDASMTSGS